MRTTTTVQFTYHRETDPTFVASPVPVELRAEVTMSPDGNDEPLVTPLDKAQWEDTLGPERIFAGKRSPAWDGADEAAIDAASRKAAPLSTYADLVRSGTIRHREAIEVEQEGYERALSSLRKYGP